LRKPHPKKQAGGLDLPLGADPIVSPMASKDPSGLVPIGAFAALSGVSLKALRLYHRLGLVVPAAVDPETGYRLYTRGQLRTLHRILLLRNAGLSLAEVGEQLRNPDRRTLLRVRLSLESRLIETGRQLVEIEAEMDRLEGGSAPPPLGPVLKTVPPIPVARRRERLESYAGLDSLLEALGRGIPTLARGTRGAVWHGCGPGTIDCEAFWTLARRARVPSPATLPPVRVASLLHEGDDATIGGAYAALRAWIGAHGLRIAGPNRELYLGEDPGLTEIQFPVLSAAL
jgi:DNA-binding transcriptional MerR regulator